MPRLLLRRYDRDITHNAHLASFPPDGLVLSGDVVTVGRLEKFDVVVWTGRHRCFFQLRRDEVGWNLWTDSFNPVLLNNSQIAVCKNHSLRNADVFGREGTLFEYSEK